MTPILPQHTKWFWTQQTLLKTYALFSGGEQGQDKWASFISFHSIPGRPKAGAKSTTECL